MQQLHEEQEAEIKSVVSQMAVAMRDVPGLVKYVGIKKNIEQFKSLVILQEVIGYPTLRDHIENYGFMCEDEICVTLQKITIILHQLRQYGIYHGRLNVNNVHVSSL